MRRWAAHENARINGLGDRVTGVCSNLLSGLAARPLFDVIVSNPPYFAGEPRDLADRAWHSGPSHRDIVELFVQARERLAPAAACTCCSRPAPTSTSCGR